MFRYIKCFWKLFLELEKIELRKPLVLTPMINVSGYKFNEFEGWKLESAGISSFGLVKHSSKAIASIMNKINKISLIEFILKP